MVFGAGRLSLFTAHLVNAKLQRSATLAAKPLMYMGRGLSAGRHSMKLEQFGMLFCLPTPACPAPKLLEIGFSLPSFYPVFQPLTDFLGTQKRFLDNSQVII